MRKISQAEKLRRLLSDGKEYSTPEIQIAVYGANHLGTARIASRVNDLRNAGHEVTGRKDADNPAIYWYRMTVRPKEERRVEYVERDGVMHARLIASHDSGN